MYFIFFIKQNGISLVVLSLAKPNFSFRFLENGDNKSSCTISFSTARGKSLCKSCNGSGYSRSHSIKYPVPSYFSICHSIYIFLTI